MNEENNTLFIPFLVFWVGQRCTMHCAHCCNLIPYGSQKLYDVEKSLEALKLLSSVAVIGKVQIQGGEPLTHPHLVRYIESIAQLPIQEISMTTNGTILFSEELLATLSKYPHIHITISNYAVRTAIRERVLIQLKEYGISHSLYDFLYGNGEWFYSGTLDVTKNDDDEAVARIYQHCANKICWTLAEGKLAVCGKIITLAQRSNANTHDAHNILDVLLCKDLGGGVELKKHLSVFIYNSQFFKEMCRYCLGTTQKVAPGIQLTSEELQKYKEIRNAVHS